jgi:hypothetical protein
MKNIYLLIIISAFVNLLGCKKDSQTQPQKQFQPQTHSLEKGLVNFSIDGELLAADIDTIANIITVIVPDSLNQHKLTATITLASQATATINNARTGINITYDFTKPVVLTVSSADKLRSTSFQVIIVTKSQYIGFDGPIIAEKSLNKSYNYYFDQMDGSTFQSVNCGPAVGTMAIKWADSTFAGTPADARSAILPQGQLWTLTDIKIYFYENHINAAIEPLTNIDSLVKVNIDNNRLVIFLIDIWGIPFNFIPYQHISKFYQSGDNGHFILVKGYKQTGSTLYFEVYDPYSNGEYYSVLDHTQIKGKDRYYIDKDVNHAAEEIEPNALIITGKR